LHATLIISSVQNTSGNRRVAENADDLHLTIRDEGSANGTFVQTKEAIKTLKKGDSHLLTAFNDTGKSEKILLGSKSVTLYVSRVEECFVTSQLSRYELDVISQNSIYGFKHVTSILDSSVKAKPILITNKELVISNKLMMALQNGNEIVTADYYNEIIKSSLALSKLKPSQLLSSITDKQIDLNLYRPSCSYDLSPTLYDTRKSLFKNYVFMLLSEKERADYEDFIRNSGGKVIETDKELIEGKFRKKDGHCLVRKESGNEWSLVVLADAIDSIFSAKLAFILKEQSIVIDFSEEEDHDEPPLKKARTSQEGEKLLKEPTVKHSVKENLAVEPVVAKKEGTIDNPLKRAHSGSPLGKTTSNAEQGVPMEAPMDDVKAPTKLPKFPKDALKPEFSRKLSGVKALAKISTSINKDGWISVTKSGDSETDNKKDKRMLVVKAKLVISQSSAADLEEAEQLPNKKNVKRFKKAWNPHMEKSAKLPKIIGIDRMSSKQIKIGEGAKEPWLYPQDTAACSKKAIMLDAAKGRKSDVSAFDFNEEKSRRDSFMFSKPSKTTQSDVFDLESDSMNSVANATKQTATGTHRRGLRNLKQAFVK
jgi:hypothetical protein